eukprot:163177_1
MQSYEFHTPLRPLNSGEGPRWCMAEGARIIGDQPVTLNFLEIGAFSARSQQRLTLFRNMHRRRLWSCLDVLFLQVHKLEDVQRTTKQFSFALTDDSWPTIMVIIEPCPLPRSLATRIRLHSRIRLSQARTIAHCLAELLVYFHERSLAYGELRPENVIVYGPEDANTNLKVKLRPMNIFSASNKIDSESSCRPEWYEPPESLFGMFPPGSERPCRDMWALGCIVVEMSCGSAPFQGCDIAEILASAFKVLGIPSQMDLSYLDRLYEELTFPDVSSPLLPRILPEHFPPEGRELLKRLLSWRVQRRASVLDILDCSYFSSCLDLDEPNSLKCGASDGNADEDTAPVVIVGSSSGEYWWDNDVRDPPLLETNSVTTPRESESPDESDVIEILNPGICRKSTKDNREDASRFARTTNMRISKMPTLQDMNMHEVTVTIESIQNLKLSELLPDSDTSSIETIYFTFTLGKCRTTTGPMTLEPCAGLVTNDSTSGKSQLTHGVSMRATKPVQTHVLIPRPLLRNACASGPVSFYLCTQRRIPSTMMVENFTLARASVDLSLLLRSPAPVEGYYHLARHTEGHSGKGVVGQVKLKVTPNPACPLYLTTDLVPDPTHPAYPDIDVHVQSSPPVTYPIKSMSESCEPMTGKSVSNMFTNGRSGESDRVEVRQFPLEAEEYATSTSTPSDNLECTEQNVDTWRKFNAFVLDQANTGFSLSDYEPSDVELASSKSINSKTERICRETIVAPNESPSFGSVCRDMESLTVTPRDSLCL